MSNPSPIDFLAAVASAVDPSSIGFIMFFRQSQSLIYYIGFKAYDVVLVVGPFFHWWLLVVGPFVVGPFVVVVGAFVDGCWLLVHCWLLVLFFIDEFFRLESVICKKYTRTNGKDSKYTNAIDISIIWSCGGCVGDTGRFIAYIASSAGSFIACIASILTYSCIFLCLCVLP